MEGPLGLPGAPFDSRNRIARVRAIDLDVAINQEATFACDVPDACARGQVLVTVNGNGATAGEVGGRG